MRNLSKADIAILEANFTLLPQQLKILREQVSQDDLTRKVLLEFPDGNSVETVLMRHDYGYSVCVSSQVGCDMGCAFCASGLSGCIRNLTAAEILAQVYIFNSMLVGEGKQVSRIVVMGSGSIIPAVEIFIPLPNACRSSCAIRLRHVSSLLINSISIVRYFSRFKYSPSPSFFIFALRARSNKVGLMWQYPPGFLSR